ncbi:hypothetical protein [Achromobacter xylosoxidans]|uniref:hypothetical protein n=1 Tax=Alcaligenes xylosoxydans xylosoxydans TaxID=85698 RepID=UPI0009F55EE8|nr:hypothetical protein [Achromobacter xylosoxidans]
MDLFTPIVVAEKRHPNFNSVTVPARAGERAVVQNWAEGFPDRDGKFVQEFQTSFNSSFWEIYLYALFKEYGFKMNWAQSSPDFHLTTSCGEIIIEATTANAAIGATPEWEKEKFITDAVREKNFWPLNREAIIRLSNALLSKLRKYNESYRKLPHVTGKPFIIAVAPFEQPDFQHQYDRAMRALLYDDYVDETAYFRNPAAYPDGPPSIRLRSVEKDNGATIDMGIFDGDNWSEVSAVIFSCVATWGKAVAMSTQPTIGRVLATWGIDKSGRSERRTAHIGRPSESISDGLQVFHNPFARHPIPPEIFRRTGVVQHFFSPKHGWQRENYDNCLQWRLTQAFNLRF